MSPTKRDFLASEIGELTHILADFPPQHWLERMSLEARLEEAKAELLTLPKEPRRKQAVMTFRGDPVRGTDAISARFAGQASTQINATYSMLAAPNLADFGRVPDSANNRLLITDTAIGSFGFVFELPEEPKQPELLEGGPLTPLAVMEKLTDIMHASAWGDDDRLAEVLNGVPARAVKEVHEFLAFLRKEGAWVSIKCEGAGSFQYESLEQLSKSAERLKQGNVHEQESELTGTFWGIHAQARTFEFKPDGQAGECIRGKLGQEITKPFEFLELWAAKPARVLLSSVQVGTAKPRYTLQDAQAL